MARVRLMLVAVLSLISFGAAPSFAQDPKGPAQIEPQQGYNLSQTTEFVSIPAGESLQIRFDLLHPSGAEVVFPETFAPDRWVVVNIEQEVGDERKQGTAWIATFAVFRPGVTTLESFPITIRTKDKEVILRTEPVTVKVDSIFEGQIETPELMQAQPGVPVWVEDYTFAYATAGAFAMALLGLLGLLLHRRKLLEPAPPPPPRKPHEVALDKLTTLKSEDLIARGEYMQYWVRLSEAVREYLGRSYGFPGTELTTTEIVGLLRTIKWPTGLSIREFDTFLRRCDEVKFGGSVPDADEAEATLRAAFTMVELTKPQPGAEEQPRQRVKRPDADRRRRSKSDKERKRSSRSRRDKDGRKRSSRSDKDGRPSSRSRRDKDGKRRRSSRSRSDKERSRRDKDGRSRRTSRRSDGSRRRRSLDRKEPRDWRPPAERSADANSRSSGAAGEEE